MSRMFSNIVGCTYVVRPRLLASGSNKHVRNLFNLNLKILKNIWNLGGTNAQVSSTVCGHHNLLLHKSEKKNCGIKLHKASTSSWTYDGASTGPSQWIRDFTGPNVSGKAQSPIDIDSSKATFAPHLKDDVWRMWEHSEYPDHLINTGKSAQVDLEGRHFVSGGGLPSLYRVSQYHFHWGKSDTDGSEHSIDGTKYSLELHVVCYDAVRFANFNDAMDKANGLAVIAVMYEIGEENPQLASLLPHLSSATSDAVPVEMRSQFIAQLLPEARDDYFRYSGSLTMPPLFESVLWSVMRQPLTVSRQQLAVFRTLKQSDGCSCILHNCRPTQPLGQRTVYRSFDL